LAARAKALIERNRAQVVEFLRSCPQLELTVPDYGTCMFPRLRTGNSDGLFDLLHSRFDTDVVPGRFFDMPDHFRLGIGGDSNVLAEGLVRLRRALESPESA
jgi:hypothetical protein